MKEPKMDGVYLQNQIDDWSCRLKNLFNEVDVWVRHHPDYNGEHSDIIQLEEELMVQYEVKPKKIPCYTILGPKSLRASFVPCALWVIGADGRVNLTIGQKQYILVDLRENHTGPSNWNIVSHDIRRIHVQFNEDILFSLITGGSL
jgi:hypothetical protein